MDGRYFIYPHVIQVPCDSGTRGVYRLVDIQTNETRDLPDVVHSGGIILKRNSKEDTFSTIGCT